MRQMSDKGTRRAQSGRTRTGLMSVEGFARGVAAHATVTAIVIAVVTLAFAACLPRLQLKTDTLSMVPKDDPVIRELEEAVQDFGSLDVMMVVLKADAFTRDALEAAHRLGEAISDVPGVQDVTTPLDAWTIRGDEQGLRVSRAAEDVPATLEELEAFRRALQDSPEGATMVAPDGEALAIHVTLEPGVMATTRGEAVAAEVEELAKREEAPRGPADEVYVVGEAYTSLCASQSVKRDLRVLLPLALVVVLGALYLSFGNGRDVVLLITGILVTVVWTIGLMAALGYYITLVSMILPIILVSMGSAAGIHVISRFRERVRGGMAARDAIVGAVVELTGPIAMTSLTTAVGFGSFVTSFIQPIREFGVFAALGIMINMLVSLTWIPAFLVIQAGRTGEVSDRPSAALIAPPRPSLLQRALDAAGNLAVAHPGRILAVAGLVTLVFAMSFPGLAVETNMKQYFREDSPVTRGIDAVEEHFGGTLRLSVMVDAGEVDGVKDPAVLNRMLDLEERLAAIEHVTSPDSIAGLVRRVNRALHGNDSRHDVIPDTPQAVAQELLLFTMQGGSGLDSIVTYDFSKALVGARVANMPTSALAQVIRAADDAAVQAFAGTRVRTATIGIPKVMLRLMEKFLDNQIQSLVLSTIGVWIVVSLIMGSALSGGLCLIALAISVVVNFGFMSYIGIPLDVVTVMISSICIGVGIDYSIHVLSRYRLELRRGLGKQDALRLAVGSTGRGVFFNAATLMLGFAILAFSGFRAVSTFGLLVAETMLTSALGALVVLPAVLSLMRPDLVSGSPRKGNLA